jgi:hypothetical protein
VRQHPESESQIQSDTERKEFVVGSTTTSEPWTSEAQSGTTLRFPSVSDCRGEWRASRSVARQLAHGMDDGLPMRNVTAHLRLRLRLRLAVGVGLGLSFGYSPSSSFDHGTLTRAGAGRLCTAAVTMRIHNIPNIANLRYGGVSLFLS